MTPPRLLVVGPIPPPVHGVSVYTRLLLDAPQLRERWTVEHLDTSDRRPLDNLGRIDATNVALALRQVAAVAARVRSAAVRAAWIPVSSNGPAYLRDALFILGAHAGGARVIAHLHGGWFGQFYRTAPAPLRWLVRASCARVDRAWVLGAGLRSNFDGLVPADRIRVVPNGAPAPFAAVPGRAGRGLPTVLHLGQLSDGKGVLDLLAAVARLRADGPGVRLVLAGPWLDAREEARIRAGVAEHGLADVVELPGVVTGEAKARLLERADLFVLASRYRYEGQPLAILEAMASGLPVVSTRRAAIPDTVLDGTSGLLVPEGDVARLAEAIGRLSRDDALRARMGAAGRDRWEREFTVERAMARVVEALEEVRGEEPVRRAVGMSA